MADLGSTYSTWADEQNLAGQKTDRRDTGIDLVATTHGTNEFHAIQCKFYEETYRIQKSDIDSFFTASENKISAEEVIPPKINRKVLRYYNKELYKERSLIERLFNRIKTSQE